VSVPANLYTAAHYLRSSALHLDAAYFCTNVIGYCVRRENFLWRRNSYSTNVHILQNSKLSSLDPNIEVPHVVQAAACFVPAQM